MAQLEEYVFPVRQLDRDAFMKAQPQPFLLWYREQAQPLQEWSFKTQTIATDKSIILSPEVSKYEVFPLVKTQNNPWRDRISVGRARNNDIVILDNSVSKLHAHIVVEEPTRASVTDTGSLNGTRLNQKRLKAGEGIDASSGDTVTFGRVDMLFLDAGGLYDFLQRHMQSQATE
jgi:pSer/pThr/pTyr-binding forkhead associated (FHA) protein